MGEDVKDVGGRPTKFKEEYIEQARKLCELGATDMQLADFFNVSHRTLNCWKHRHPEFMHSLRVGKEQPDENVKRALYQRALGYSHLESKINVVNGEIVETVVERHYPPDATSLIFWLKNRCPDEFRDKVEHEHSGDEEAPIKVEIVATNASKPERTTD